LDPSCRSGSTTTTTHGKPRWTNTTDWNVEVHTLHGASACAFSGQEDTQFPESPDYSRPRCTPASRATRT
jgi:hypothetical protein